MRFTDLPERIAALMIFKPSFVRLGWPHGSERRYFPPASFSSLFMLGRDLLLLNFIDPASGHCSGCLITYYASHDG